MKSLVLLIVFSFQLAAQGLDISGWKLIQTNAAATYVIPNGTIMQQGSYVIIARNAAKTAFESFWGVTLPANVVYLNTVDAAGVAPKINGSETFELQNSSNQNQDGPTVGMPATLSARTVYQRKNTTDPAGAAGSWNVSSSSSPGSGMTALNSGKVVISEFADDAGSGNFVYEFVELFYDVTPQPQGQGTGSVSPPRWKFNTPIELRFVFKPQSDTLRGFSFVKPGPFTWDTGQISTSAGTMSTSGDTVFITGITLAGTDSLVVSIPNTTASDTTNEFTFNIGSSQDGSTFLPIQAQPKTLVYGSPRPISMVKQKNQSGVHILLGKWAVVQGIVTVANEFGGPSYLQDATAGMAVFDSSVSNNVERGDEVVLLGLVAPFNELFEFVPCILLEKLSEGNAVDTVVLTASQITGQGVSEPYESRLIRINNVTVNTSTWTVSGSGTNYILTDATGTVQTRISPRVNFVGFAAPSGQFDIVGVLGQFFENYQLLPRYFDDIIVQGAGPRIVSFIPYEKNITSTSITFHWTTDAPGSSIVNYGLTPSYGSQVVDTNKVTQHEVTVSGLSPATIYHARIGSENSNGTTLTGNYIVSTASQNSTGQMNVYLSKSVNTTVALNETAMGNVNLSTKLIERINAAKYSIDVCLYSLSGTVGANIASALISAKNRGVKIRMIAEDTTSYTAPMNTMKTNVPFITDKFDPINGGHGLMHNKFVVFDYRSGQDDSIWVWTGSWNATDPGTNNDMQNAMEIQDKALAGAYTLEFQEMWGSSTDTPSAANSRFGARKTDTTPHLFNIGGVPLELYFSPSDKTTSQIIKTVNQATSSINIAMLTFTRSDIATALRTKHNAGVKVRGLLDNNSDQGSQWTFLTTNGMDFLIDVNSAFLHHKYAVVDADKKNIDNYVITGSHNWSSSAENSNNENTLIIRNNRIANLFLQEFKARYIESGGQDNIIVRVEWIDSAVPATFGISQNFPNPFNPTTRFEFRVSSSELVSIKVYDVLGREAATLVNEQKAPGVYSVTWNPSNLSSGVYYYRMTAGSYVETKKMMLVR